MKLINLLKNQEKSIVQEAASSIGEAPITRYRASDYGENLKRISKLFEKVRTCIEKRDVSTILDYTRYLAKERHQDEFPLHEVFAAYNTLEGIIWRKIMESLESADYAESLSLVSTTFGYGKECLASEYVTLTEHAPPC